MFATAREGYHLANTRMSDAKDKDELKIPTCRGQIIWLRQSMYFFKEALGRTQGSHRDKKKPQIRASLTKQRTLLDGASVVGAVP